MISHLFCSTIFSSMKRILSMTSFIVYNAVEIDMYRVRGRRASEYTAFGPRVAGRGDATVLLDNGIAVITAYRPFQRVKDANHLSVPDNSLRRRGFRRITPRKCRLR